VKLQDNPLYNDLLAIVESAVQSVDPYKALKNTCTIDGKYFEIEDGVFQTKKGNNRGLYRFDLSKGKTIVVGAGKAASRMAMAMEEILGQHLHEGLIVTKYGHTAPLKKIRQIEAGHPIPDENGMRGAQEIESILNNTSEKDTVFVLVSGGGSALLTYPPPTISLKDKQDTTNLLLSCGATIHEMNTIRKHLSKIKGGQLAKMATPATVVTLILSDVIGDDLSVIASGPTAPDDSSYQDALRILQHYDMLDTIPSQVKGHLEKGAEGKIPETPTRQDPLFEKVFFKFVGSNQIALQAAAKKAESLGYTPLILTNAACGEAREIAKYFAAIAKQLVVYQQPLTPPACILSGGEPTVTLKGKGKGGRNQEFTLAAGLEIAGYTNVLIASIGTDGTDGPTDAAGGFTDGEMLSKAKAMNLDPATYLENNNAYPFLEKTGYLVKTGPTGTNVMDIHIILCKKP